MCRSKLLEPVGSSQPHIRESVPPCFHTHTPRSPVNHQHLPRSCSRWVGWPPATSTSYRIRVSCLLPPSHSHPKVDTPCRFVLACLCLQLALAIDSPLWDEDSSIVIPATIPLTLQARHIAVSLQKVDTYCSLGCCLLASTCC